MSLVEEVKKYALEHYEDGGWDVVVECWTDENISEALLTMDKVGNYVIPCTTLEEATTNSLLADVVSIWADRQADATNSTF